MLKEKNEMKKMYLICCQAEKINNSDLKAKPNLLLQAVKKKKPVGCHGIKPVIIRLSDIERDAGIQIASGMYVSVINQGSPAAMEGSLAVGDRILSVSIDCVLYNFSFLTGVFEFEQYV